MIRDALLQTLLDLLAGFALRAGLLMLALAIYLLVSDRSYNRHLTDLCEEEERTDVDDPFMVDWSGFDRAGPEGRERVDERRAA